PPWPTPWPIRPAPGRPPRPRGRPPPPVPPSPGDGSGARPAPRGSAGARSGRASSEPPGDVRLRALLARVGEDAVGGPVLHQLTPVEKGRVIRDARRLLHVVGHDDDRVVLLQLVDELLDPLRGDGIQRRG